MNSYSAKHSVLVMDNARIHHNDNLVTAGPWKLICELPFYYVFDF